nr:MAG TPA: hypothetical protein [Caudoviricetes sp.]
MNHFQFLLILFLFLRNKKVMRLLLDSYLFVLTISGV